MIKEIQFFKKRPVEVVALLAILFLFYYQIASSGIATHDELLNFYKVQQGTFFENLTWERWGMTFLNLLPSYIQVLCTSQWTYRLFTMLGLLISCIAFSTLIKRMTDGKMSVLVVLLFFMFAQLELEHDGLFAFSFSYQINTCYVFFALALYWDYLKSRKRSLLIWSGVLYLLSSMAYEAFILYGALFFIITLYYWIDMKRLTIFNLFKDLIFHASLASVYVISYFLIRSTSGVINGDAMVGTGIRPVEFIATTLKLGVGLFPLNYMGGDWRSLLIKCFQLNYTTLFRWALTILLLTAIVKLLKSAKTVTLKTYIRTSIFCLVGMLLPGVLLGMTNKFVNWIYYGGVKSFGTSYYSYFFIILWIAVTMVFLYQVLPWKRVVLSACCIAVAIITQFTLISNQQIIDVLANQQDKYDLYHQLVKSDYFASIEDDAQLYAPDYVGIHYDINTLAGYANKATDKQLSCVNQKDQIDYNKNVYELKVDVEKDVLYFAKIAENRLTNEVYICSLNGLNGYGVIADRSNNSQPAILSVNGKSLNIFDNDIVTGRLNTAGRDVTIQCDDMFLETVEIYQSSNYFENGNIKTFGIYGQEDWGRWAQKEFGLNLSELQDIDKIELTLHVAMPAQADAALMISCGTFEQQIVSDGGVVQTIIQIPVEKGCNEIKILSSAPNIEAPSDPRAMNVQIFSFLVSIGGQKMELNNP